MGKVLQAHARNGDENVLFSLPFFCCLSDVIAGISFYSNVAACMEWEILKDKLIPLIVKKRFCNTCFMKALCYDKNMFENVYNLVN